MASQHSFYTHPSSMEPLLPTSNHHKLAELSCEIFRKAGQLSAQVPSSLVRNKIAYLVREMNSYYSNLIEGHKTLPYDIERALKKEFSKNLEQKNNQLLSLAHIQTQTLMEERLQKEPQLKPHAFSFISWLHQKFYHALPAELHVSQTESGKKYTIQAGSLRDFPVTVGQHTPPAHQALLEFLKRFEVTYSNPEILPTQALILIAASHHRLAWIHPFADGNGRVLRLYSHALFIRHRMDSLGLWTLSRGLARQRARYYQFLAGADQKRIQDHDGRGNLSDRGLAEFCQFFLETALDQIEFMSSLLELPTLSHRIEIYLQRDALHLKKYREELARLLKTLLIEGEIARTRVQEIIGRKETVTREVIKLGLQEGLMTSPSVKGKLSIAFSAKTLESYFPQLFVDLAVP